MISDKKTEFTYNDITHTTYCTRHTKRGKFTGRAQCHPNDYDFESKLLGQHYAYTRSMLQELCESRDELRAQLKGLNRLYSVLKYNPRVDPESTECYIVRRQIKLMERDLEEVRALIKATREELCNYIETKDKFYKKVREERKKSSGGA